MEASYQHSACHFSGLSCWFRCSVMGRSKLSNMIFGDGLIYFVIAFLFNLLATIGPFTQFLNVLTALQIFMLLDSGLNPVMTIIANVPATIFSSVRLCITSWHRHLSLSQIVACRAVCRLSNYTNHGPEVFGLRYAYSLVLCLFLISLQVDTLAFHTNTWNGLRHTLSARGWLLRRI